MTVENVNMWLATTRALDQGGEALRVAVPTPFNKTWLEQKLAGKVAGVLHKIDYAACALCPSRSTASSPWAMLSDGIRPRRHGTPTTQREG